MKLQTICRRQTLDIKQQLHEALISHTQEYITLLNTSAIYVLCVSFMHTQNSSPWMLLVFDGTPIMPFTNQAPCSPEQDGSHWMTQPGTSNAQYAQPDRSKTDKQCLHVTVKKCFKFNEVFCTDI